MRNRETDHVPVFQNDFLGSDSSTLDEIHEEDEEDGDLGDGLDSITTSDLIPRGTNLEPALNIPILPHLEKYSIVINKTSKQSLGESGKHLKVVVFWRGKFMRKMETVILLLLS